MPENASRLASLALPFALFACASGRAALPAPTTAPVAAVCPPEAPRARVALEDDTDRTLYALGILMGQRMGNFSLSAAELAIVQRGIADQVTGGPLLVPLREWGPRINEMADQREADRGARERRLGRAYEERMASLPGARRMPSGLIIRELRAGLGARPRPTESVRVNYRGTLIDGTEFDTTYQSSGGSEPAEFPLEGVIACWREGITLMNVGGQAVLVCPSGIAYGDRGQRVIPPGATLTFEVELVAIVERPPSTTPAAAPDAPRGSGGTR